LSIVKNRLISIKNKLFKSASSFKNRASTRWRSLNPGFRYALLYFVSVVCIASVVWWQFNPGSSVVFVPDINGDTTPPAAQEPSGTQDQTEASPQLQLPMDTPDHLDQQNEFQDRDLTVFIPSRDKLSLPLDGEILLGFGEHPFEWSQGVFRGGLDGIHIDGTRGDVVCSAWYGVVEKVIQPDTYESGEVWISHGEWRTVYRNLTNITVSLHDSVNQGDKISELASKIMGLYAGDYLEFELWSPEGPQDPMEYVDTPR
jgi:murein DD-endopeptidase MepM/ murein hydrolase activator NlpD